MKTIVTMGVALAVSGIAFGESWVTNEEGKVVAPMTIEINGNIYTNKWGGLTREEIAARKQAHVEAVYRSTGGKISVPDSMKGKIRIVNATTLANADIQQIFSSLLHFAKYDLAVIKGEAVSVETATKAVKATKAELVVFVVENDAMPSFIAAPEDRWAIVNAKACGDASRTRKEVLRAFAYIAGAATSDYGTTVMSVTKPMELDMVASPELPFDVFNRIQKYLKIINVTPEVQSTYKRACEQGWAPQPTNDVQKAIWDKVHAVPATPMKIEFDPKKGR